jgi:hypothetical protein
LIPTKEHLKKAIINSDVRSVELLLKAGAPIAAENFVYLLTHATDSKLITIEGLQLFKLLCQACANRKVIPVSWDENKVRKYAKGMDKVLQDNLEVSIQWENTPSESPKSEIDWTKGEKRRRADLKAHGMFYTPYTYEEYADGVKKRNEYINQAKMFLELKQILPDGYEGELEKAGLLTKDSSQT